MESVLIVDDHPVVRGAVKIVLRQQGFKRIYETDSGNEVMRMIRELKPNLVVLDLNLPSLDGLEVLGRIQAAEVGCRVVIFTSQEPEFFQDRCMRAGAAAYVDKTKSLEHLQKAVHAVSGGYTYFSQLPTSSVSKTPFQLSEKHMIDQLSDRELTILQQLARGRSNKAIADNLHLSHKTVSTYKTRLIEKLNVDSLVHLRDLALRHKLI
ncbi:response regulator transcription factor [Pseudomonas sp. C2B4]|uniref:response regulator transcription factor n=1 Tax=Pseudomonas sp. C2B4 TaxID=2735270 RepID=UPI00158640AC|nr:response regulator transcription factor [Pseudomonas sp. C2B4]NUU39212.1 response regulator transcription factor [Pseudomonas sp. C2B4]